MYSVPPRESETLSIYSLHPLKKDKKEYTLTSTF